MTAPPRKVINARCIGRTIELFAGQDIARKPLEDYEIEQLRRIIAMDETAPVVTR